MADYDMSDVSVSESSWADAQADTPTMGEGHSGSEDTLSNLSFDNLDPQLDLPLDENQEGKDGRAEAGVQSNVVAPVAAPRNSRPVKYPPNQFADAESGLTEPSKVRVCVTDADIDMDSSIHLPPGAEYVPSIIDLPKSPSQLKIIKGAGFLPTEETGPISEDESSISSCAALLDLDLQNGDVRLKKRASGTQQLPKPNFIVPSIVFDTGESESSLATGVSSDESIQLEAADCLDDYIEDLILPYSHEPLMSRQLSFRRKIKEQLESAAAERAVLELDKFEAMLSTYDEEDEYDHDQEVSERKKLKNINQRRNRNMESDNVEAPVAKSRKSLPKKGEFITTGSESGQFNRAMFGAPKTFVDGVESFDTLTAPMSLDIDQIVKDNAPNLMGGERKGSGIDTIPENMEEPMSSYFLPQPTLDKLYAVYESSNFNNIYCLSGELKDILTATEIEEIVANKDHLEKFIDPNVMAALSWSITEASLPYMPQGGVAEQNKLNVEKDGDDRTDLIENGLKTGSKSSSLSNGFHSDASGSEDDASSTSSSRLGVPNDDENDHFSAKKIVPVKDEYSESSGRASTASESVSPTQEVEQSVSANSSVRMRNKRSRQALRRGSQESLETDLGVCEDDWEDDNEDSQSKKSSSSGVVLLRRDSKRWSKGKDGQVERIVEGLFVESKNPNPNGTLRRIKAPLNLGVDLGDDGLDSPEKSLEVKEDEAKSPKVHKKRITVDDKILSVISTDLDENSQATDATQSDVFHSFINTLRDDDDPTIKSDGDDADDITLDIDTPDDMEDSILEQLDSLSANPIREYSAEEELEDNRRWKSFKVGPTDIQIDLKAIHPYRRVLSHGGYFDAEKNIAIILFSACYLPDRTRKEYTYIMDHLFLYVLSTLEELVVDDYILVYLHGATPKSCMPTFSWLKRCYQLIDRRLKKNLKALYLVHPTFWLRTVVALTKPFVSTKFSKKVQFINTLSDLCLEIPTEHLVIPDRVLQYDFDLKVDDLKRRKIMS